MNYRTISEVIGIFILTSRFVLYYSYDNLSRGRTTVMFPKYQSCQPSCGPTTATDGQEETCTNTGAIGVSSRSKTTSWSVDLLRKHSIYSISILFREYADWEMRQRGRFAGFSLYISNTPYIADGHLCYKNRLPLPPLEFNTTCIGYGRYVIYYNERLDGVTYPKGYQVQTYTQLCEVEVKGCAKAGVYGSNCYLPCPDNCQGKKCNILDGTCFGCIPGWTGDLCTKKCPWGWHGQACKSKCPGHCRGNLTCDHITGQCEGGCSNGWMGIFCDVPCPQGYFGRYCSGVCSQKCISACDIKDGFCDCAHGWKGSNCNEKCPFGNYGINCEGKCSLHCGFNDSCDIYEGTCPRGCQEPYTGSNCSQLPSDPLYPISTRDSILPIPMPWFLGATLSGVLNLCLMLGICVISCSECSRKKCNTVSSQDIQSSSYISSERRITSYDVHNYQEIRNSIDEIHYQEITSI